MVMAGEKGVIMNEEEVQKRIGTAFLTLLGLVVLFGLVISLDQLIRPQCSPYLLLEINLALLAMPMLALLVICLRRPHGLPFRISCALTQFFAALTYCSVTFMFPLDCDGSLISVMSQKASDLLSAPSLDDNQILSILFLFGSTAAVYFMLGSERRIIRWIAGISEVLNFIVLIVLLSLFGGLKFIMGVTNNFSIFNPV
jgi:hypothetical protein